MKFKKAILKSEEEHGDKKYAPKDVVMMRITLEYPVLRSNMTKESAEIYLSNASECIHDSDLEKWITVEYSDVTNKDIAEFAKNNPDWYMYDPTNDRDTSIKDIK